MRRGVPFLGVFFGVLFAELLPGLFLPFFFPMVVVLCRRVCGWRVSAERRRLRGECSGTILVEPLLTMMMTFPVAAGTKAYRRVSLRSAALVLKLFAVGRRSIATTVKERLSGPCPRSCECGRVDAAILHAFCQRSAAFRSS